MPASATEARAVLIDMRTRNRLRLLAERLDPGRRLRGIPRRLREVRFKREHAVADTKTAGRIIAETIRERRPAAIGKIGNTELRVLRRAFPDGGALPRYPDWLREEVFLCSGVFPPEDALLTRFAEHWAEQLAEFDPLGVWYTRGEAWAVRRWGDPDARFIEISGLEPYLQRDPWSLALEGRRVLVVTPFARSVERQYARRREVWSARSPVLPEMDLRTLPVPHGAALVPPRHSDWFDLLRDMTERLEAETFDVVLIGAGALAVPLCAHAKRMGRIGVHTGGTTQVMFGIRGGRFDAVSEIVCLMNEHWIRPAPEETPERADLVENRAYW